MITKLGNYESISHELGHTLHLHHTLKDAETDFPNILKSSTTNFMDYTEGTGHYRDMFFTYQWHYINNSQTKNTDYWVW